MSDHLVQQIKTLEERCSKLESMIQTQERLAVLGSLSAGIAHELKNPLNFINNFSQMSLGLVEELKEVLSKGFISTNETLDIQEVLDLLKDLEENIRRVMEHSERATRIVRGMLASAREGDREKRDTDINKLLETNAMLAYHAWRAKDTTFNVTFQKEYDTTLPLIPTNEEDLGRAILNIVDNACQATHEHLLSVGESYHPTLRLKTEREGDTVIIRLRDNGPGIPQFVLDKIFNPFFTTKPVGSGTGLGLSITWDIVVNQHQGTLSATSTPGNGTEFCLKLPINTKA